MHYGIHTFIYKSIYKNIRNITKCEKVWYRWFVNNGNIIHYCYNAIILYKLLLLYTINHYQHINNKYVIIECNVKQEEETIWLKTTNN